MSRHPSNPSTPQRGCMNRGFLSPLRVARAYGLPSADTAAMLFCALPASGQINMRKVDD